MGTHYEGLWLNAFDRTAFLPASGRCTIIINPKSACSTLKFNVWHQEYEMGATQWAPPAGRNGIHRKDKTAFQKASILDFERALFDRPVFSIVRNPYSRILSAYLDKIAGNKKEKRHLLLGMGYTQNMSISFAEFIDFICRQNSREMDAHYAPQAFLMQIDYLPYNKIGCVEEIDASISEIMADAYNVSLPDNRDFRPHRTNASSLVTEYFTDDLAAKLLDRYRADFDIFGYSVDPREAHLPPTKLENASKRGAELNVNSILRPSIRAAVAMHKNDYMSALEMLSSIASDESEVDIARARALTGLNRLDEACTFLQRAVERTDNVGRYWVLLGECLLAMGRVKEAVSAADKAATIAPYSGLLRRLLAIWNAAEQEEKISYYQKKIMEIEGFSIA